MVNYLRAGYEVSVRQAMFHWHVEDNGIRHVYIKP